MFLPNLFLFFHGEEDSQTLVVDVLPEPLAGLKTLMAIANKHSGLPSQNSNQKKYPSIS